MTPKKRKELLIQESNNPDSLYINTGNSYGSANTAIRRFSNTITILKSSSYNWEIYKKSKI